MSHTAAYRLWQAPFAEKKFQPVYEHNDLETARRVLDVGCGPGTNTARFRRADYLGLDLNPSYIEYARRRHGREFVVADATSWSAPSGVFYDFVLLNSFLHHLDDGEARQVLEHLAGVLTPDGHVHVLDLVLPARPSLDRLLARLDRGDYPRPLADWRRLFSASFEEVVFEPYTVGMGPVTAWSMVYFKGRTPS